jgi:hypothetical protein
MIRQGLRTLAVMLAVLCALTAVFSLVIGAAADMGAIRSISAGYMLVGSLLFTAGAVVGLRDPGRSRRRQRLSGTTTTAPGLTSWTDAFQLSAVLVGFGICLVLLGVLLHPNTAL